MRDGEHKSPVSLAGQKYYVVGRGRYKPFTVNDADAEDADYRNILPLDAGQAFEALQARLTEEGLWGPVEAYFQSADLNGDAFRGFLGALWAPTVRQALVAHSGLAASDHSPLVTNGGYFCFDVKLAKLMSKKMRQVGYSPDAEEDLDINGNLSRTRGVELLRILHTKLAALPDMVIKALMRGTQQADGSFPGIQGDARWPENDSDEPFASAQDSAFEYSPEYAAGPDGALVGPTFRAMQTPWGLLLAIIKPGSEDDFEASGAMPAAEEAAVEEELSAGYADPALDYAQKSATAHNDPYPELKGSHKASPWGPRHELAAGNYKWLRAGNSILGFSHELIGGKPALFARAHRWGPQMPALLAQARAEAPGTVIVWFPPSGTFKTEGYYGNDNIMNTALMAPWIAAFGATHGCPAFKRSLEPADLGLRGGHFLFLE